MIKRILFLMSKYFVPRFIKKNILIKKIIKIKSRKELIKIIIGSGATYYLGWVPTDSDTLNLTKRRNFDEIFSNTKVNNFLAEHVFEHLKYEDSIFAFKIIYDFLDVNGTLRIAVPDKNHPSQYVYDLVKPGGLEPGADDHKFFWDYESISNALKKCGFKVDLVEYFDDQGFFHSVGDLDDKNGYISRCSKNYIGRFTNSREEFDKLFDRMPRGDLEAATAGIEALTGYLRTREPEL